MTMGFSTPFCSYAEFIQDGEKVGINLGGIRGEQILERVAKEKMELVHCLNKGVDDAKLEFSVNEDHTNTRFKGNVKGKFKCWIPEVGIKMVDEISFDNQHQKSFD